MNEFREHFNNCCSPRVLLSHLSFSLERTICQIAFVSINIPVPAMPAMILITLLTILIPVWQAVSAVCQGILGLHPAAASQACLQRLRTTCSANCPRQSFKSWIWSLPSTPAGSTTHSPLQMTQVNASDEKIVTAKLYFSKLFLSHWTHTLAITWLRYVIGTIGTIAKFQLLRY